MTVSYGHVLFRFMSGENGAGEPLEAEGERRLGEEEPKHDDSHWSPQFSMLILFVAWVPVFVTLFKLVNVSKNFVMVASIESYTNNRMVLLVMRRVQTRSAFLALKLTEIMKRPKLMKAAARADSSNVEPITVFERMAYRKIFDEFDDDKGGSVTHEELVRGIITLTFAPGRLSTSPLTGSERIPTLPTHPTTHAPTSPATTTPPAHAHRPPSWRRPTRTSSTPTLTRSSSFLMTTTAEVSQGANKARQTFYNLYIYTVQHWEQSAPTFYLPSVCYQLGALH